MHPGPKLKEILQSEGFVLKVVAAKTGIPYSTLKKYLNADIPFPESKLRGVCSYYAIDPKIFGLSVNYKNQLTHKE